MPLLMAIRSTLFYTGYIILTVTWGTLSVLVGWTMPYRKRFRFIIGTWTRLVLGWLALTCGIRPRIKGLDNLPDEPCIVFVKHESTWETLFLQTLLAPQATIIKKELLRIPFFGWAFAVLKPIAIDRRRPRAALKTLINEGRRRLEDGIWVVLFPEGTRTPPGEVRSFQAGGAALAVAARRPLVVIAHNAGDYWPAHRFLKRPGTVQIEIAAPIDTESMTSKDVNDAALTTMRNLVTSIRGQS